MSFDRLLGAIIEKKNPSVVGLDPAPGTVPPEVVDAFVREAEDPLVGMGEALSEWGERIVDAVHDIVPAVKPQMAYYEAYGWPGLRALEHTVRYARQKGLFVILDGKRNDIGSTMQAYAAAYLGQTEVGGERVRAFEGDALTVNGYLGTDGIDPLLRACEAYDRGIFVLVKTSNPSSGELQDRECGGKTVYAAMGELCETWGAGSVGQYGYSSVGAVVGATYPEQLQELRAALPHTMFLVPGYGAQGGSAADIAGAFDGRGLGAIVNSSRGILCAWKKDTEKTYDAAAREAALRMKKDIISVLPPITR